jgi:hypothetical protein
MTRDLFDSLIEEKPPEHNPGGKVKTPIAKGIVGDAEFYGSHKQYRLWLSRRWDALDKPVPYVLWVGMNPSTADADANDPTITREITFTKSWGYSSYIKTNVMDYRATNQKDLLAAGVEPRSDRNLETIVTWAARADRIVLCYGVLPKQLKHFGLDAVAALKGAGHASRLFSFGTSLNGFPRHPLYLASDTSLVPFRS